MKKQTLEEIVRHISEEEMDEADVRSVMNALRKKDAVVGDLIVYSGDVEDIMYAGFGGRDISEETEGEARTAVAEEIEGLFDTACEHLWDALCDDIDDVVKGIVG